MRFFVASLFVAALAAQTRPESVTVGLQVRVGAACELAPVDTRMDSAATDSEGTVFTGSTRLRYWLRTSRQGGEGNVSLRFEAPAGSRISIRSSGTSPGSAPVIDDAPAGQPIVVLAFGANQHTTQAGAEAILHWRLRIPAVLGPGQIPPPSAFMQCR